MTPEEIKSIDDAAKLIDTNPAAAKKALLAIVVRAENAPADGPGSDDGGEIPAGADQPIDDGSTGVVDEARLRRARVGAKEILAWRNANHRDPREADAMGRGLLAGTASRRARLAARV
jgi:hypothetical protein